MRKQSRSAAFLMVAALAAAPIIGGLVGSPVSAQQSEDRTDSEEYTASRADYWEARAAYAARKAATQARKAAGVDDEESEEFEEGGDEEWGGEWGEEAAGGGEGAWADDGYPTQAQLYALRVCESTDDYTINSGNGYYGAYQFSAVTWWWLGYSGYPHHASPAVQDQAVRDLYAIYGWSPWPACSRYLGFA